MALLALGAVATAAPGASAQGVEVTGEAGGDPCAPCGLHIVTESYVASLTTGVQIAECDDELEGTIDADGSGELVPFHRPHGANGCGVTKCAARGGRWSLANMREVRARTVRLTIGMCLRGARSGQESRCEAEMSLQDYAAGPHLYATAFTADCAELRFDSRMKTESYVHEAVEIVHSGGAG